ncbi:MAG: hypothetical protein JNL44_04770 [Gemmatimonadetes bacterium]|nr:hypothetical protein [Gemmatimonadota bacterium]
MMTHASLHHIPSRALLLGGAALLLAVLAPRTLEAQDTAIVVNPRPAAPGAPAPAGRPVESVRGAGPNGATLRCRDGSYPAALAPDSACEGKGGVLVRFPLLRTPQNGTPAVRATGPRPLPGDTVVTPAIKLDPVPDRSNVLVPAELPPADATLQCGDGTYVVRDTSSTRCAGKGGVAMIFPPRRRP